MQAIDTYDPIERHVGNGLLDVYTFEFLITEAAQLLGIVLDASGEETLRFRGNESISYFTSLTFDATNGGGSIDLLANLPTGYTLILLLAADEPVQTSNFTAVGTFALDYLQSALNKLGAFVQRASWLAQRGIRLNDAHNSVFDPQLPLLLEADRTLCISTTGLALALGPTIDELLGASADVADAIAARIAAQAAQVAAENAQIAAELAETNAGISAAAAAASAVAAAASAVTAAAAAASAGYLTSGPFACLENASTALTGETTASGTYTQVDYIMRVLRGTTVLGLAKFSIFFRNGAWELAADMDLYVTTALGVTFTVHATTAQITAVVDNSGAGNATITAKKIRWTA